MSDASAWLVVWPVLLPILGAALAVAFWGRVHAQTRVGLVTLGAQLLASLFLFSHVWANGPLAMSMGGWPAPFGIALVADTFGAGLTVVACVVAFAIGVHSVAAVTEHQQRSGFFPLVLALMAGVAGAFLTSDIFNLYVWFEVTLISSFGLMVLGGRREQIDGAVKYAVLNLIATTLLLIAIGLLYGLTGTLNMADLNGKVAALPNDAAMETVVMLFLVSLGMKSALFPLYFWLPAAYHTPLPTVSAIFAALLTKVGVYSLIRVFTLVFPEHGEMAREVMIWTAVATMVLGALGAMAEPDIRRVVSYTVISGVGIMVAGLALGTSAGLRGAAFYIVHSIVVSAALFIAAGLIARACASSRIAEASGLYKSAPVLAVAFLLAGLSLAGVPPFAGFWPKVYLVQAGLAVQSYSIVAAVIVSGFLTLVVVARTFALVFWREREGQTLEPVRMGPAMHALIGLVAITVLAGLFSAPIVDVATVGVDGLLSPETYIQAVLGPVPIPVAEGVQ